MSLEASAERLRSAEPAAAALKRDRIGMTILRGEKNQ